MTESRKGVHLLTSIDDFDLAGWYGGPRSPLDEDLRGVVGRALSSCDFDDLYDQAFPQYEFVLSALGERLMGWAVRDRDPTLIDVGLFALYLSGADNRSRDSEIPLSLPRRAAELLAVDLAEIASAASLSCSAAHRSRFLSTVLRTMPPPEAMGFWENTESASLPYFLRVEKHHAVAGHQWAGSVLPPQSPAHKLSQESDAHRLWRLRQDRQLEQSNEVGTAGTNAQSGAWTAWLKQLDEGLWLVELCWLPSGTRARIAAVLRTPPRSAAGVATGESGFRGESGFGGARESASGSSFEFGGGGARRERLQGRAETALTFAGGDSFGEIVAIGVCDETSEKAADWLGSLVAAVLSTPAEAPDRQLARALDHCVARWKLEAL